MTSVPYTSSLLLLLPFENRLAFVMFLASLAALCLLDLTRHPRGRTAARHVLSVFADRPVYPQFSDRPLATRKIPPLKVRIAHHELEQIAI